MKIKNKSPDEKRIDTERVSTKKDRVGSNAL